MLCNKAGQVRVYNEQHLVSVSSFKSPVNAMAFGRFGREDNTLISVSRTGMDAWSNLHGMNCFTLHMMTVTDIALHHSPLLVMHGGIPKRQY